LSSFRRAWGCGQRERGSLLRILARKRAPRASRWFDGAIGAHGAQDLGLSRLKIVAVNSQVPFNHFHERCNLREHTHEVLQLRQGGPDASIVEVEHSVFDAEAINPEWSAKNVGPFISYHFVLAFVLLNSP